MALERQKGIAGPGWRWTLLGGVFAVVAACGGTSSTTCATGDEGCPCTSGGACNPGLVCLSKTCVRLADGGADASVSGTGPDGGLDDGAPHGPSDGSVDSTVDGGVDGTTDGTVGSTPDSTADTAGDDGGLVFGEAGSGAPCVGDAGWACRVTQCEAGATTLTGRVFDPAGKNPLYNAYVFIPNEPARLPVIHPGTQTCDTCDTPLGAYVVATQTSATGSFTLQGVPTGSNIPVTVQLGKWRRTTYVNVPNDCGPNSAPDGVLRLPRKKSEGDMPQMALLTGGCDDVGCFLLNMGIDSTEFGAPHAGGRVDVYQGNSTPLGVGGPGPALSNGTAGNCTTTSCPLWGSKASLEAYDLAVLSCECSAQTGGNESVAGYTNLHDWVNEGGKVFATHYHYTWFSSSPDPAWRGVATWLGSSTSSGSGTYDLNATFPKGLAYDQWLADAGVLSGSGPPPTLNLSSVGTSVSNVNAQTTLRWIYDPSTTPNNTKSLSFETPVGGADAAAGAQYCGKAVFTDIHSSAGLLATAANIPADCVSGPLTAQQKALEFLFFDLSACVAPDNGAPPPPPPSGP